MHKEKQAKVGIGFATGRKSFQKVLRTNIYNWKEAGLVDDRSISLNLIVAYDLDYHKTKETDYTNINQDLIDQIDSRNFIGNGTIQEETDYLVEENVVTRDEIRLIFGKGYAAKRNAVLYIALKKKMDYLVFLDDDEYPVAVTHTRRTVIWGGQQVLSDHLKHIAGADITHGHHCGYISPIPHIQYDKSMTEEVFQTFIEAISNDIINWDNLSQVIHNGGITYADTKVLTTEEPFEVQEFNGAKFISGANLCINLTDQRRIFPFYNPPGARGEDTFLSTCLHDRKVLRVPCYTFHDGFSTYNCLLDGVLPVRLKKILADNPTVINRFYRACLGWIRYKPLYLYITDPEDYDDRIQEMREKLQETLPKICTYFGEPSFMSVLTELEKYHRNVKKHYKEFRETQLVWAKIMDHFAHLNP